MKEKETSSRVLAMLRYKANRYQAMGNGGMTQLIYAEIRKLTQSLGMDTAKA